MAVRVYDYQSGAALEGVPSGELVEASFEQWPEGAVSACRYGDGLWQFIAPAAVEFYRHQGFAVMTVYCQHDAGD